MEVFSLNKEKSKKLPPKLRAILEEIGRPETTVFTPDPFQLESLENLQKSDVLVSAPTGSGKTWIAVEATRRYLAEGKRVWYASPLKALSNSKYEEFKSEFGNDNVGILTGDRKENPDAPIIIGTTEILRNQLYDCMYRGENIPVDFAVLDEAHYLGDPERGVVWEEVLIYLPPRVRCLLLSATISNAAEISRWLKTIRHVPCQVVTTRERPVPLRALFLFPRGDLVPFLNKRGIDPQVKRFLEQDRDIPKFKRRGPGRGMRFNDAIQVMREHDLLPAIFFLKSRVDCDNAINSLDSSPLKPTEGGFRQTIRELIELYPHLKNHKQLDQLLYLRAASHHGGQLPYWKVLIEKLMNAGHLEVIFSTSTVAAGVNFPARTVVLVQSDRFNGREFLPLTSTELHQMIGRAGRRGKDNVGFALILPGLYQDPLLIYDLLHSPPEPILSQININFSMAINLLLSHSPEQIKELLELSFAAFLEKRAHQELETRWNSLKEELHQLMPGLSCKVEEIALIPRLMEKQQALKNEIRRLKQLIHEAKKDHFLMPFLKPGRIFRYRGKGLYVLFETFVEGKEIMGAAQRLTGAIRVRGGRIKLKKILVRRISGVYDYRLDLPEDLSKGKLMELFAKIPVDQLPKVEPPEDFTIPEEEELRKTREELRQLLEEESPHLMAYREMGGSEIPSILRQMIPLAREMERTQHRLWVDFLRHLEFLKETGFVDEANKLTPDGLWASRLRIDQPLLIAEGIRLGIFEGVSPEILAALIAPFVSDKNREVDIQVEQDRHYHDLGEKFQDMLGTLSPLRKKMRRAGFESPEVQFWPAVAVTLWAKGLSWEGLTERVSAEDGDLAMLILRTADHLRQIRALEETHPALARTANEAISQILREPVLIA